MWHPLPGKGSGEVPEPVVGCLAQDRALLITWISCHLLFKQFSLCRYPDISTRDSQGLPLWQVSRVLNLHERKNIYN